jgi:hypothetical protein
VVAGYSSLSTAIMMDTPFYVRVAATSLLLLLFPLKKSAASFVIQSRAGRGDAGGLPFTYLPRGGVEVVERRIAFSPHRKGRIRHATKSSALYARNDNVVVAATAATHGGEFFGYQAAFDLNGNVIMAETDDKGGLSLKMTKTTCEVLISEDQEDTISSFRKTGGLLFSWRRKTTTLPTDNKAEGEDSNVQVEHLNLTSSWVARTDDDFEESISGTAGSSSDVSSGSVETEALPTTRQGNSLTIAPGALCAATGVASSLKNASLDQFRIETIFALPDNQRLRVMVPVCLPHEPASPGYSRESRTVVQPANGQTSTTTIGNGRGPQPLPPPPLIVQEPIVVVWECRYKAQQSSFMFDMGDFGKDSTSSSSALLQADGYNDQQLQLAKVARNFASKPLIPWEPVVSAAVEHDAESSRHQQPSKYWDMVPPKRLVLTGCNATVTFGYRQVYRDGDNDDGDDDDYEEENTATKLEWFLEVGHYIPQRNYIRQVVKRTYFGAGYGAVAASASSSSSSSWCYFDTMSVVEQFLEQGNKGR